MCLMCNHSTGYSDGACGGGSMVIWNKPGSDLDLKLQFGHSVMYNSLPPHGLQHTRLPCPSPTPGACSNSCPSSQWCHPTISSSVVPFSSCLQSFPASGSFPVSQLFASGGQSIGASASASVFPMNIWDWFPLRLTDLKIGPIKFWLWPRATCLSSVTLCLLICK